MDLDPISESLAAHISMIQPLWDMFEESAYDVTSQEHLELTYVEYKWNRL